MGSLKYSLIRWSSSAAVALALASACGISSSGTGGDGSCAHAPAIQLCEIDADCDSGYSCETSGYYYVPSAV